MNLIIGNCAGTFSTILKYFSWKLVSDISKNNINLYYHFANKTDFSGNSFYYLHKVKGYDVHDSLLRRENLMTHFFDIKEQIFPTDYEEYVECYPHSALDLINECPDFLIKYSGGGWNIQQYYDNEVFSFIRKTYHDCWKEFKLSDYMKNKLHEEEKILKNKKVLAVMVRYSGHYLGSENSFLNDIIEEVKNKMNDYDNILLITQVQEVFDYFMNIFGDKCIAPDRERISGDIDWKGGRNVCMTQDEYVKEIEECIIDVFLTSQASHIMSGASNMLLGALSINPDVPFSLFDKLKTFDGA